MSGIRRRKSGEAIPDLNGSDLRGSDLRGVDLRGVDLRGALLGSAILEGADLSAAQLNAAQLGGADLSAAQLGRTDLSEAMLSAADLSGTDLASSILNGAILSAADLSGARCWGTAFANVDLSEVKGLESIRHDGPSTIGIDTLFRSGGKLPDVFLRGCGVPETLIVQQRALIASLEPIQFYSCFISYSTKNQDFAERLHSKLRDKGLRVWFAPEDVQGGKKLHDQIDEAIRLYDKLLLVLSPESMNSEWVNTEIRKARKAEIREKRRKLFPIRLVDFETIRDWECFDADSGKDLGVEIREFFIPDFSHWENHRSFELAFARLLKDLMAEESTGAKPV